jgi:hypothetical protein
MNQLADSLMGIFGMTRVKTKKPGKKKLTPLPTLIDKADKAVSTYIRLKYADHAGNVSCVSCGKVLPWQEAHCAHYIGRASKATRWEETNLAPACNSCNVFHKEFHMREYTLWMLDTYGRDHVDKLRALGKKVLTGSQVRALAEEAIAYCKASAANL